ncbi:MAG: hypothetical protein IJ161_03125 [Bacteroidales bacterium]|nr:hypothetical protein [Bacteroidales bacterium]
MKYYKLIAGVGSLAAIGCAGSTSSQGDAFLTLDKNSRKPVNVSFSISMTADSRTFHSMAGKT